MVKLLSCLTFHGSLVLLERQLSQLVPSINLQIWWHLWGENVGGDVLYHCGICGIL